MLSPEEVCFIVTSRRNSPFAKHAFCLIFFQFTSAKLFGAHGCCRGLGMGIFHLSFRALLADMIAPLEYPR